MFYPTKEFSYENVKKFVNTVDNSSYILITKEDEYNHHSKTKLKIKHLSCGNIFNVDCHHFVKANNRCPKCNKAKYFSKKTEEKFKEDVFNVVGDEYTVIGKYINKDTKIELLHNICGNIYNVTPGHFLNTGCRCTFCKQGSRGETAIAHILEENNIDFIKEFRFKNLYNQEGTCRLKFDFAIFKNKHLIYLIEYDGPQHEKPTSIWGVSEEDAKKRFERQVLNDRLKDDFCINNNIPLLRIPYNKYRTLKKINDRMDKEFLERFNDYPELEYTKNQIF